MRPARLVSLFCLLFSACGQAPEAIPTLPIPTTPVESPDPPMVEECVPSESDAVSGEHVFVYFGCTADGADLGRVVHQLPRSILADEDPLARALEELLAGPTAEESALGYISPFSAESREGLISAVVEPSGRAIVDLDDLIETVPSGGTTSGALLLAQLYSVVFQFPEARSIEFRMEGSCDTFWIDWIGADRCQEVPRSFWEENTEVV
ncbi:MAG: GerMN domain-containing protein [Actinomycetota bacterium]